MTCLSDHRMWEDGDPVPGEFISRVVAHKYGVLDRPLPVGEDCLPDPDAARAMITPQTRAIALVSPNNPTGPDHQAMSFGDTRRRRNSSLDQPRR